MDQYNLSITSTFSTIFFLTNQSINQTLLSSTINKNTFMRYAQVIYVATLVTLGVCGNILCTIVFCTKSLRRIRSSAYLFILALIDSFFLMDLLPGMIHTAFFSNLYRKINFICYIQTYISFVASFIHIWMVLAFTAERFFAVNFPLKHMSQCTPNLSHGIILIIIIPAFICYIHPAFFVSEVDNQGQCREKNNYEHYLNNLNIVDTIMTIYTYNKKLFCSKTFRQHVFANGSRYQCRRTSSWPKTSNSIPSIMPNIPQTNQLISYRSQCIIRPLRSTTSQRRTSFYRTFTNYDTSQTSLTNNNSNFNSLNEQQSPSTIKNKQISSARRNESAQRHILTELRLTKMLLAISFTCLLLNFPSYYLRFIFLYEHSKKSSSSSSDIHHTNEIDFSFYRDIIFHCMSYLSYSINIVIYLLFGGNFRRALKRLFSLTTKRSENFNLNLRSKKLFDNDKMFDYDSTGTSLISPNNSLRNHIKLPEQANLRRTLCQQQIPYETQK